MKFRLLFIVFNVVILASFLLILLTPAFVLGWEYTSVFWSTNWPVGLVFLVVLAALNGYFVYNWRVFTLLEREDWAALMDYLETVLLEKKRITRQRVRILVNAYVVTGKVEKIGDLESFLRDERPNLVPRLAIELGIPHLLSNDGERMIEYFGRMKDRRGVPDPVWVRWCYAFALMTAERYDEAKVELAAVLEQTRDVLLRVLTAHMLEPFGGQDEEIAQRVREEREALRAKLTREKIDRELERQRQNLQVLFLTSRIGEARDWVFTS
ncbi:MAG: hypothetical protein ACOCW3_00965 [Spirochaetota bacterium]